MTASARVLAAAVGAVLSYAGARKLVDLRAWMRSARRQSVPSVVAATIPAAEIVLGAALVGRGPEIWSLAGSTVLLTVFTSFVVVQVLRGSVAPCACFGAATARPPRWLDVMRNLALIGLLTASAALV